MSRIRRAWDRRLMNQAVDGDPPESELAAGAIWYNTETDEWRGYDGTDVVTFNTSADAG